MPKPKQTSDSESGSDDKSPPPVKKSKNSVASKEADSGSDDKSSRPARKSKSSAAAKVVEASDSDSGPDDRAPPPEKKSKSGKSKAPAPKQWTLEGMRQVRINEFRGRRMVDIREFYEKGGEVLPGKKGISLTEKQWLKLLESADEVTKALGQTD